MGGGKLFSRILDTFPYQTKSKAAFNCVPNHHTTQMPDKKSHGSELPVKKQNKKKQKLWQLFVKPQCLTHV